MKRSPLHRRTSLQRTPMKKRGRKPAETLRIYGPNERREWMLSLPCIVDSLGYRHRAGECEGRIEQSHTANEGKSRKGHYSTLVPKCSHHHRMWGEYKAPFNDPAVREDVREFAAYLERVWQAKSAATNGANLTRTRKALVSGCGNDSADEDMGQ